MTICFQEIFQYTFMQRAIIVGLFVSLCSALLGVPLVLKQYSMIGDGLSHVGFGALAVATALNLTPLPVAIVVVTVSAFILLRISEKAKVKADSLIALISTVSLAIGVVAVSMSSGMNMDINNYLFGSILALDKTDVYLAVVLGIVVIFTFFFLYHQVFSVTFDESFAKATGANVTVVNLIISIATALTIVIGMRIVGTLLMTSMIIFPALTSMRLCKSFKNVIICSSIVSLCGFLSGILISFFFDTPTGASIVLVNLAIFISFYLIKAVMIRIRLVKYKENK
ncbi:MAG: metal ABC transporter permease [Lachnospiraceae bacterium]|nr:metal ABC transporter permease [Lachnospiraceae bacterium]